MSTLIIHPLFFFLLEPQRTFQKYSKSEEKLLIFSVGKMCGRGDLVDKMMLLTVFMSTDHWQTLKRSSVVIRSAPERNSVLTSTAAVHIPAFIGYFALNMRVISEMNVVLD